MNLESIALKLEQAGQGTRGTSIFVNMMPADKSGIMLREHFSGTPINAELPAYRKSTFQIVARGHGYAAVKALAEAASAALTLAEVTLTGMRVKYMRPRHEPVTFPLSAGDNVEFLVNIDCCFVIV